VLADVRDVGVFDAYGVVEDAVDEGNLVKESTGSELVKSAYIYGDTFAPQIYVLYLTLILKLAAFRPFTWLFEAI
jgi:hypothetical protein